MMLPAVHLIRPTIAEHLQPIARFTADVFSDGNYADQFRDNYIGNSHYDWETSRLVMDGEQIIHHWGVWGYAMRVESILLRIAGVGAVATHPQYRVQGWMHQAAADSCAAMAQAGYDLSILRGRHYAKIGYARAWNYVHYRLKLDELPLDGPPKPYRPLEAARVNEMDALYNQTHAGFTGVAIRPTYRNRHPDDIGVYAWFDADDRLAGYIRALPDEDAPKTLLCLEAAGDPYQGLAVMAELYQQGGYEGLACFTLPHLHPLLHLLRRGACVVEDRYFAVSGWRVRLINLAGALRKLVPLFEARLAQSQFAGWSGSLLLDSGEQQAILQIGRGAVAVAQPGTAPNLLSAGPALARLLIGSDEPDEIIHQEAMRCSGLALPLVRVLFPNLHPMMSHWDEY